MKRSGPYKRTITQNNRSKKRKGGGEREPVGTELGDIFLC